ncbi:MAG TPA: hypothetical protein VEO19_01510 [Terriglobia bacterium]|nr:hypothetical protein [Terriglobia bacterium]
MVSTIASYGLQYGCMLIEAALICYCVSSARRAKRELTPILYLASLLGAALARSSVLRLYGYRSSQYSCVYWSTDFLLVIAAFLLVCLLFRRACFQQEKLWRFVRLLLFFTFLMVVGISGLSFLSHYGRLSNLYITEFSQNMYFTCLVLNTLLYLMLLQIGSTDDQLGLLVCGVGIQFAGPAASMALYHLTTGEHFAASLATFTLPVCSLGMLLVWAYAIVCVRDRETKVARHKIPAFAEATAD